MSDSAMIGIRLMFSIFPGVLAMLSAFAIVFHSLSSEKVWQIEKELAERRRRAKVKTGRTWRRHSP